MIEKKFAEFRYIFDTYLEKIGLKTILHIALFTSKIAANTGNIIRLTICHLHLIESLGFDLEEKTLRRAALDYRFFALTTKET